MVEKDSRHGCLIAHIGIFKGSKRPGNFEYLFDEIQKEEGKGDDFHDRDRPRLDGTKCKRSKDQQKKNAFFNAGINELMMFRQN